MPNKFLDNAKDDANDIYQGTRALAVLGALLVLGGTGFYFWQRNVGSNLERDLALNSGQREFSMIDQVRNTLTTCESHRTMIETLKAERDQYSPEHQPNAWAIANQNLLGTATFLQQCQSELRGIIETSEVESVPEFSEVSAVTGTSLQSRVQSILGVTNE